MNPLHAEIAALRAFLAAHPRLAVLSGAGISAGSGIPTYRDQAGVWRHREPIRHEEFINRPERRRRYWLRSLLGWPAVRDARPNAAHLALARLEAAGGLELVITQNVDRLHQRAGSRRVVDLHGRLDRVRCLDCGADTCREQVQHRLLADNPGLPLPGIAPRPDGDADVADDLVRHFRVPACAACGGTLIPDVVFFGGAVPAARVQAGMAAIARADALLAVGSSLQVYSGFRFCREAARLGRPLVIVNPGTTRADHMAMLHLRSPAEQLLPLALALIPPPAGLVAKA